MAKKTKKEKQYYTLVWFEVHKGRIIKQSRTFMGSKALEYALGEIPKYNPYFIKFGKIDSYTFQE